MDTTTSGVEQLRALMGQGAPGVGITRLLGMQLEVSRRPRSPSRCRRPTELGNAVGVVHGGIAATLLDSAMGCAVHSALAPGERYTTLDLHVHYIRPIPIDLGHIVATGEIVHRGGRLATAEGRLVGAAERCSRTARRRAWCCRRSWQAMARHPCSQPVGRARFDEPGRLRGLPRHFDLVRRLSVDLAGFADVSPTSLSWVLNAYTIVFAALLIPAGRLADRVGRRRTFLSP